MPWGGGWQEVGTGQAEDRSRSASQLRPWEPGQRRWGSSFQLCRHSALAALFDLGGLGQEKSIRNVTDWFLWCQWVLLIRTRELGSSGDMQS